VENSENLDSILVGLIEDQKFVEPLADPKRPCCHQFWMVDFAMPSEFPASPEERKGFVNLAQE